MGDDRARLSTPRGMRSCRPSLSPTSSSDIIRERIGFDGFLMSDDIGMEALSGDVRASAPPRAVAAGCDVALHCSGEMDEMVSDRRDAVPRPARRTAKRGWRGPWRAHARRADDLDFAEAVAKRDALLALV